MAFKLVGLTEADAAVDEEGVISLGRLFGNGHAGCVGKLVARPDDEPFEVVVEVKGRVDRQPGGFFLGLFL